MMGKIMRNAMGLVSIFILACALSSNTQAEWRLDSGQSTVNFISVKKGSVGETHTFRSISSAIDTKGIAILTVDLSSVDTAIDIRNIRMIEHLFEVKKYASATFTAQLEMAQYSGLKVGQVTRQNLKGVMDLHGVQVDVQVDVVVQKLSAGSVLVMSESPLLLNTKAFNLNSGVDKLMELAKLPSITRVVPVSFSLVYSAE